MAEHHASGKTEHLMTGGSLSRKYYRQDMTEQPSPGPNIGRILPSGDGSVADNRGQNEKKEAALSSILSKGQITALAALSVADIDLLRQHLDRNRNTRFYDLILGLIIACLVLQILGGLITIMVAHMRSYYQKHRIARTASDVCTICCGCKPRPSAKKASGAGGATAGGCCGCCGCFTCRTQPAYEYAVISEYELWCSKAIAIERQSGEASEGLESFKNVIQNCQEMLESYQRQYEEKLMEKDTYLAKKKEVTMQMNTAMEKRHHCLQQQDVATKFLKDGEVLYSRVDDIHKNRTMEKATFFTHTTNYLLFAVAILHALILGLGVFTLKEVEESMVISDAFFTKRLEDDVEFVTSAP